VSYQALNSRVPKPWIPEPFFLIVLLWAGVPKILVLSLGTVAMWIWNPATFQGEIEIPKRSYILFGLLGLLSVWLNIVDWSPGKIYQGEIHTMIITIINLLLIAALIIIAVIARQKPAPTKNIAFHWLLFVWFVSYAFPFLGELP